MIYQSHARIEGGSHAFWAFLFDRLESVKVLIASTYSLADADHGGALLAEVSFSDLGQCDSFVLFHAAVN